MVTAVSVAEDDVFKGRHFDRSVILLCVRWYLAYNLSLRNLEEMMAERGISVDHATVHRWVVRYSPRIAGALQSNASALSAENGISTRHISKCAGAGCP